MKWVAGIFIAVHAVLAAALFALSVHGPTGLAIAAPLYFAALLVLVVWASVRRSWRALLAGGFAMLAVAPAAFFALDYLEQASGEARVAATRVSEVHDEPIVSAEGRPIGIRLSFVVSVPQSGEYAITPSVYGAEGLYMNAAARTLDGRTDLWRYEAGRAHKQSAELYPPLVMSGPDGARCLSRFQPTLPAGSEAALRIVIHETPYAGRTERPYNLAQLYRNVMAEGLPPCKGSL